MTGREDRVLLVGAAFLRSVATGAIGVLLGLYLARVPLGAGSIGIVVSVGLAGAAAAAALVTLSGDRFGRRRSLVVLALAAATGGVGRALGGRPAILAAAAYVGMAKGMGRDRGAALVLEQAALPGTGGASERTRTFAIYNLVTDAGHALGALAASLPALLAGAGSGKLESLRLAVWLYAALMALPALLYVGLSPRVEVQAPSRPRRLSRRSAGIVARLSALFALDGLGGGFLTTALLSYFFFRRFGVSEAAIGPLFFAARVLNALSHLAAARLARRIGLVNTMVFTHVPSSLLLVTVAIAPSFTVAAALFLLREGLVEMDVPTRQSYVMAVVAPEERTFASGVTHLVRLCAWAVAPSFAGLFMQGGALGAPLMIGAGMKIAYDLLLYAAFRRRKPPEEAAPRGE